MSITRGTSTTGTNDGSFRRGGQQTGPGTVTGRGYGTPFGDSATATTADGETLSAVYENTGGPGFKIMVNGKPASREQSDRVRAALTNAGYVAPDGSHTHVKIPVDGNPADADSVICHAVLRGSGQIPESGEPVPAGEVPMDGAGLPGVRVSPDTGRALVRADGQLTVAAMDSASYGYPEGGYMHRPPEKHSVTPEAAISYLHGRATGGHRYTRLPESLGTQNSSAHTAGRDDGMCTAQFRHEVSQASGSEKLNYFIRTSDGRRHQIATSVDTRQEVDGVVAYTAHDTTGLFPDQKIQFTEQMVCW